MTKQEVLNYLDNVLHPIVSPDNWNVYSELHDMIEELPSAEPVRHGKWNIYYRMHSGDTFICDRCGSCFVVIQGADKMNFCPNCGAKMDEETV